MKKDPYELIAMCLVDEEYTPLKTAQLTCAEQVIKNYAFGLNHSKLRYRTPKQILAVNPTAFIKA